jgi:hypothetical protein
MLSPSIFALIIRKIFGRKYLASDKLTFEFTENLMEIRKSGILMQISWKEFTGRIITANDISLYFGNRGQSYFLPKRIFSAKEWLVLTEFILEKVALKPKPRVLTKLFWLFIGLILSLISLL